MESLIAQASKLILQGKLVCFPTETVYALAADATNAAAVQEVYQLKGRDSTKPLAVFVTDIVSAEQIVQVSGKAKALMEAFCPGPLTVVLPRRVPTRIADNVNPGIQTLAVRIPDHAVAMAILKQLDRPIVATSVNRSGEPPAITFDEAKACVGNNVALVVPDQGARSGVASTVVDLSTDTMKILRQGSVSQAQIEAVIGRL